MKNGCYSNSINPLINRSHIYGWNADAWRKTLLQTSVFSEILTKEKLTVLEIGASKLSTISLSLDPTHANVTIGYFDTDSQRAIEEKLRNIRNLRSVYRTQYTNIFDFEGKFDVIIMKSVLGGVIRSSPDYLIQLNDLLAKLKNNHLNKNGFLITLDNGQSFFEKIIGKFGARKNEWKFFEPSNFKSPTEQQCFGVFSAFSISTRLGILGVFLERLIFCLDLLAYKFFKKRPTVICTVYRKD